MKFNADISGPARVSLFGWADKRIVLLIALLIFAAAMVLGLWAKISFGRPRHAETLAMFTNSSTNLHVTVERDLKPLFPTLPKPLAQIQPGENKHAVKGKMLSIYVPLPITLQPGDVYAPGFRLLQCVLVNTVDSAIPDTPIIGLVIADLYHNGKLIVPKGTEIHGRARLDRARDRILSEDKWTMVFQTGEELIVSASALDREFNSDGSGYGLNDGSGGMRGDLIKSQNAEEVKLFLATFLSGMASGLEQSQSTITGLQIPGTAHNAALAGTSQVLNEYAKEVLEAIRRDGVYIRVPAGKQFYVYVKQPIERGKARIGASISLLATNATPAAKPARSPDELQGIPPIQNRQIPNTISNLPALLHLGDVNQQP